MKQLAAKNLEQVLDLLSERLAFERAGVKLYDTVLRKARGAGNSMPPQTLEQLEEHRNEEKEHEEWLEAQIRSLGGDAHAKTERVKLVELESSGIERVVQDDATLSHLLHALLTAELADNAGWDLLVQLADEAGDRDAKREFKKRLHEEEEHLIFARRAVLRLARREVLGQDVSMPMWP
jgi:bacterioferritin (cytochrome b1)